MRGGFPEPLLARDDEIAWQWCADFLRSYLDREIPFFAPRLPRQTLSRLWTMLAHTSGSLLNSSRLASNLSISSPTVDRYIDLLVDLGLARRLSAWFPNATTRVTKSPKVFLRDTGLLHALLDIRTPHALLGHPIVGASFESFCVESLLQAFSAYEAYFYRTARGDEIDLVLTSAGQPTIGVEIKLSSSASIPAGFHRACDSLGITQRFLVHGGSTDREPYQAHETTVTHIAHAIESIGERLVA